MMITTAVRLIDTAEVAGRGVAPMISIAAGDRVHKLTLSIRARTMHEERPGAVSKNRMMTCSGECQELAETEIDSSGRGFTT
jgi:hypothetical protein